MTGNRTSGARPTGIPTAIVAWDTVDMMGRQNMFLSFWERPQEYALEMTLFNVAVIIAAILAMKTPTHKKVELLHS